MSLNIFGTEIPTNMDALNVFGEDIDTLIVFGTTVWQKQKYYYVTFSSNGGTGTMTQQTMPVGISANLKGSTFSRTGYTFYGWAVSSGGTRVYTDGQTVRDIAGPGATKALYALWQAITYTVAYYANGATSGSTASSVHTYDVGKQLTLNGYTRPYFTFVGWARSSTGSVAYSNAQWVSNLSTTLNGVVSLYAAWRPVKCLDRTDKCTPVSGGISSYSTYDGYKDSALLWYDSYYGYANLREDQYMVIQTNGKVDLTHVNYIKFEFGCSYAIHCGAGYHSVKVNTNADFDNWTRFDEINSSGMPAGYVVGNVSYTMDVRNVTGYYYIKVRAHITGLNAGYTNAFHWYTCTFS